MTAPPSPAALHDRALGAMAAIVAAVAPAQYDLPTPCPEFTVLDLLGHLVAGNRRFTAAARGEDAAAIPFMVDLRGLDALAAHRESSAEVSAAWQDPALLEKSVRLPFAEVPGDWALGIHTVEQVVHGWDLATATGQPIAVAPELCDVAWNWAKDIDDSLRGPKGPFGPPLPAPAGASDLDRLVAWLGRTP